MDVGRLHARRLLPHVVTAPSAGPSGGQQQVAEVRARAAAPLSSLDATVITVLSLLLCGLVVVLAVHSVVRCAFRVTRRACYGQEEEPPGGAGADASARERGSCQQAGSSRRKGGAGRGRIPSVLYSPEVELAGCGASECAICLTEFANGERVRALPHCNHGFHVRCIDRWLAARQTCPTCRRAPFAKPAALPPPSPEAPEVMPLQVIVHAGQPENNQ